MPRAPEKAVSSPAYNVCTFGELSNRHPEKKLFFLGSMYRVHVQTVLLMFSALGPAYSIKTILQRLWDASVIKIVWMLRWLHHIKDPCGKVWPQWLMVGSEPFGNKDLQGLRKRVALVTAVRSVTSCQYPGSHAPEHYRFLWA